MEEVPQWLLPLRLYPWLGLQFWRRPQGRDDPPFCLTHTALTLCHTRSKLLHLQPSHRCQISAAVSLPVRAVPPQKERG